ncbi:MAG: GNAT family N-acyltransferase [Thiohalocapsa sp.]|jgi:putative hemolysin
MGARVSALPVRRGERLFVELAADAGDVQEAQALRYRVFAQELGARLKSGLCGLDVDELDDYCHHLIVRETKTGQVVGCTRLLNGADARRLGRWYSENEFDLGAIPGLPGRLLEVGRTCISPESRHGSAIAVLWSGIAGYIQLHGIDFLFGCASVPLGEGDYQAAAIMNRLRGQAMAEPHLRVTPRSPLRDCSAATGVLDAPLPALLKAYVRLGAKVCGEPCRDPDFDVGDVLMLLDVNQLSPNYARHFMERVG